MPHTLHRILPCYWGRIWAYIVQTPVLMGFQCYTAIKHAAFLLCIDGRAGAGDSLLLCHSIRRGEGTFRNKIRWQSVPLQSLCHLAISSLVSQLGCGQ